MEIAGNFAKTGEKLGKIETFLEMGSHRFQLMSERSQLPKPSLKVL